MILILLILTAALLEAGAIIGGFLLTQMLRAVIRTGRFENDEAKSIAILIIAIAACLVGAVHVMPA